MLGAFDRYFPPIASPLPFRARVPVFSPVLQGSTGFPGVPPVNPNLVCAPPPSFTSGTGTPPILGGIRFCLATVEPRQRYLIGRLGHSAQRSKGGGGAQGAPTEDMSEAECPSLPIPHQPKCRDRFHPKRPSSPVAPGLHRPKPSAPSGNPAARGCRGSSAPRCAPGCGCGRCRQRAR